MYVLQDNMKRNAVYSGSLNGLATRLTINSLWRECQTIKDPRSCGDAVMHPDVIGALLAR